MAFRKLSLFLLTIIIGVTSSGCGTNQRNQLSPIATIEPPIIAEPTQTNTPAPTLTPSPEPEARLDSAYQSFMEGDYVTAQHEYQNVIDFSQDAALQEKSRVKLARIAYLEGDSTKALELYRKVINSVRRFRPQIRGFLSPG